MINSTANSQCLWYMPKWLAVALPLLAAALPSVFVATKISPLYTDLTLVQSVLTPAYAMPHYPPLYPYFAWAIHKFANAACGLPPGLSDCGLYSLVFAQQALFVMAIFYFAISCAETMVGRLVAIVPFYLMPVFALVNYGFQTEAIWVSLLIVMLAACYRIARHGAVTVHGVVVLALSFTAALLVRQTTLFVAPVVPLVLGAIAFIECRVQLVRAFVIIIVTMVCCVGVAYAINRSVLIANHIEPRVVWGRGTIEVIQRIVVKMEHGSEARPPQSRTTLIPKLQSHAEDPLLRNAIPTIMKYVDATYDGKGKAMTWGGAHYALMRLGTQNAAGLPVPVDFGEADQLVNEFCVLFVTTYPGLWFRYIGSTFDQYLGDITQLPPDKITTLIKEGLLGRAGYLNLMTANFRSSRGYSALYAIEAWRIADLILMQSRPLPSISGLPATRMATRPAVLMAGERSLFQSWYMRLTASIADWEIIAVLLVLVLWGWISSRLDMRTCIVVVATLTAMIVYIFLASALLAHLPRYDMPYELLLTAAAGYTLAALFRCKLSAHREYQCDRPAQVCS